MADHITLDALAAEIRQRMDATDSKINDAIGDDALVTKIKDALPDILDDDELKRKLTFAAGESDPKLGGTKYGRAGMSVADIEYLHDLQSGLKGQRKVDGAGVYAGPSEDLDKVFRGVSEAKRIDSSVAQAQDLADIDRLFRNDPSGHARTIRAAMDTAESGFGQQLVGAQYVAELWDAPRRLGRVAPLIESFEMTAPTAYLPVEAALPEMLFVAESTANNSSNYDTVKTGSNRVQVDAKKFVIHQMWSGEMEEDSIIAFVPFLRRQAGSSIAHYLDSLVVNGDTTNAGTGNINLDDADPADTKHYLAYDGIRHASIVDATGQHVNQAGPETLKALLAMRTLMIDSTYLMDWGHPVSPDDLVYLCDPFTGDDIANIDEVLTADKYGAAATIFNGELAKVGRHPLISTIALAKAEADGKVSNTGSNNTKGQVVAFNRRGCVLGWRRMVQLETERLPATDQTRIVYSLRNGFGRFTPTGAASGIKWTAAHRNITLP